MGERDSDDLNAMIKCVQHLYIPNKVTVVHHPGERSYLSERLGVLSSMKTQEQRATAYVCHNYVCTQPISDVGQLTQVLDARKKV